MNDNGIINARGAYMYMDGMDKGFKKSEFKAKLAEDTAFADKFYSHIMDMARKIMPVAEITEAASLEEAEAAMERGEDAIDEATAPKAEMGFASDEGEVASLPKKATRAKKA